MKKEQDEHRKMPVPIEDATPEQVARIIMQRRPKKQWKFMNQRKRDRERISPDS